VLRQDSRDLEPAPPSELDVIEREGLRDTQAYLAVRTRGLTPSARQSAAWERFYRAYAPLIRACLRARGLSDSDRDDCEQEVWKEVVAHLRHFAPDPTRARLRTWLTTVACNKVVDVIRLRTRHPQEPLTEAVVESLPTRDDDPATAYERHRTEVLVCRALAEFSRQVSECNYRVLLLRSIEERDVAEVADQLGLTSEQVRFRHCRVKQQLRRLVEMALEREDAG
jgi:RNA polymerase sigma factor (sigma-70 family)